MPHTYRLIAPVHPAYPMLGQRVLLQGPNLAELKHVAIRIITRSPNLAHLLQIIETEPKQEPTGDQTIHIPTVVELTGKSLIFWSDADNAYGLCLN